MRKMSLGGGEEVETCVGHERGTEMSRGTEGRRDEEAEERR